MAKVYNPKPDRLIELSARPIRYAYVLGSNPEKIITKIISDCCEAFGGVHNLIIPSNGETIDDYWAQFIIAADPDVIFLCGSFSDVAAIRSYISKLTSSLAL